jgi:hypothetical protein
LARREAIGGPAARRHALCQLLLRTGRRFHLTSERLTAIATVSAAIAAGLSYCAARQQERATYDSQLYSKQVELAGPIYPELMGFSQVMLPLPENPNEWYARLSQDNAARSDFIAKARRVKLVVDERAGALLITFPDTVTEALAVMGIQLRQLVQALEATPSQQAGDTFAASLAAYTVADKVLFNCVKPLLQAGQPVRHSDCTSLEANLQLMKHR